MKIATALALALPTLVTASASAQPAKSGARVETPTYVAQDVAGDQVVTFTGDELAGLNDGPYSDVLVRRPPGAVRVGLIRPRMNFVAELRKSVENL